MVKVTNAAIARLKEEIKMMKLEGEQPFIRLSMGIG